MSMRDEVSQKIPIDGGEFIRRAILYRRGDGYTKRDVSVAMDK